MLGRNLFHIWFNEHRLPNFIKSVIVIVVEADRNHASGVSKKGRLKIWIMGPDEVSIFFVSWTLEVMIVPYCFDKLTLYCIISFHFWSELSLILVN